MKRLSELALGKIARLCADHGGHPGSAVTTAEVHAMAAELRDLRALLATPLPCGWPAPQVVAIKGGTYEVAWEALEEAGDMKPDEVIALGAALINAALTAKRGG